MADVKAVITELQDASIQSNIEEIAYSNLEIQYCLVSMKSTMESIHGKLSESFEFQKGAAARAEANARLLAGDKLEKERESKKGGKEGKDKGGIDVGQEMKDSGPILGILAAITGSIAGLAVGFVEGLTKSINAGLKMIGIDVGKIFKPITDLIGKYFGKGSRIGNAIDDIIVKSYVIIDDYIIKPFTKFKDGVKKFFKPVGDFFAEVKKLFGFGDDIGRISKTFGSVGKIFKSFFKVAKAFGSVLGKLFIPIQIIMSIVDTIKGAVEGFTSTEGSMVDKIIGGIFGGIKGLVNGLLMIPLDLLKDGISWIAEKLGFSEFSGMLDSFSFEELFTKIVDGVRDMVFGIKDWIVENLSPTAIVDALSSAGDAFNNWLRGIVKAKLPPKDSFFAKFIPDAVYEFAEAPPPEEKEPPKEEIKGDVSQKEVEETDRERQEREMAEFKARAKAAGGAGYTETTGADGETVATTMKPTALGQASIDAASAVDSANAAKLEKERRRRAGLPPEPEVAPAPVTPTPEPKTAAELAKQKEITDKMKGGMTAGEAVRSTQPLPVSPSGKPVKVKPKAQPGFGESVAAAADAGDKIDELDAKIAELDAALYDRATFEGMSTREEVQAKKEELFKERKKLRDEKEKLKAQQEAAFAAADAAEGDTGDDFYGDETSDADFYGDGDDLEDTSGMTLTSSTGGTTVTGGTETVRAVDQETLARDRAAVDASRKRMEAEKEAFRQLEAEGVIGADEFLMDDDPRYAQLQQRTEAIMSGRSLQPGASSQALTGELTTASAQQRELQAAGAAPSINAPTSNNVNNNNVSTTNTLMPPPPSTDTTDRYASQFGAGR